MASRHSFRFAVLDLDETLIEGSVALYLAKHLLLSRLLPKRYYVKLLRYTHLPILSKLKRFYRIYRYLLHRSYDLYMALLRDPHVDKEKLKLVLADLLRELPIPEVSKAFVERLKSRGYRVVLVTATPQEFAEVIGKRLGVDEVYGSRPGRVLDREEKARLLQELRRRGRISIVVGNPGNEPFWMAEELAIMVRSPKDLKGWLKKI